MLAKVLNTSYEMKRRRDEKRRDKQTCLSMNSLVSFSMCPSYKLVVMFIRPIFDSPKSVSLMWPMEVINKLQMKEMQKCFMLHQTLTQLNEKYQRPNVSENSVPTSKRLPVF